MYRSLLRNHILTNLAFALVLVLGWLTYYQMPRERDPSIDFDFAGIITVWPGASATDIEKRITQPLEDGIEKVPDIKYISSSSGEGVSNIAVRFNDLDDDELDDRMADLRREVQNKLDQLPDEAQRPEIARITSSNALPTATLLVVGQADDEILRKAAYNAEKDLERMIEVEDVSAAGDTEPELQVRFSSERLVGLGVSPVGLAETVSAYFHDMAAGKLSFGEQEWLVRLTGTSSDPTYLEQLPIVTARAELPLRSVANVVKTHEDPSELIRYNGRPAVLLSITKKAKTNNLQLLDRVRNYFQERNRVMAETGIEFVLLDDQTESTRQAIRVMERNALIGLGMVLLVTWVFLGLKIAFFTSLGIPFVLAGTFAIIGMAGGTVNSAVLLGIVISLGMLVDDAVVVVEAIYQKLERGVERMQAVVDALQEVVPPVTTAVLTSIAVFVPLMFMPGVLGDFMQVVPIVVSIALLMSLVEAFWMLPSHIIESNPDFSRPSRLQRWRRRATRRLKVLYIRVLIRILKKPSFGIASLSLLVALAVGILISGLIRIDFFATDLYRLFYVTVEMPPGTRLEQTLETLERIEKRVRVSISPDELRETAVFAGQSFTESKILFGDEKGQIFVSLNQDKRALRSVNEIIDDMRELLSEVAGPIEVSFMRRNNGPPTAKPISINVRGDEVDEIRNAVVELKSIMRSIPGIKDISDDDTKGRIELSVRLNADAITRAGLNPADVIRVIRLYVDGEIVTSMRHQGELLNVRVRAMPEEIHDVQSFFRRTIGLPDGSEISLGTLLDKEVRPTTNNIRHYNLRRAITVEAEIDKSVVDTVTANRAIMHNWETKATLFPGVDIDMSGELDDVQESLDAMLPLFVLGLGLVYLILGTQFRSYIQPILILTAVPSAFIGVIFGLYISENPLSLYTLYGIIALSGISANDAIVLISNANKKISRKLSVGYSIISAAKSRMTPIIITSLTTMAGLFSLAMGLGGESLMWGPMATAIVWGLAFSTLITLFFVPLFYSAVVKQRVHETVHLSLPSSPKDRSLKPVERVLQGLLKVVGGEKDNEWHREEDTSLWNEEQLTLYESGASALREGDFDSAILNFQRLADEFPSNCLFNSCAAQAHVMYMQRHGWDVGYIARARRYIRRAKRVNPENPRVLALQRAFKELESTQENKE